METYPEHLFFGKKSCLRRETSLNFLQPNFLTAAALGTALVDLRLPTFCRRLLFALMRNNGITAAY